MTDTGPDRQARLRQAFAEENRDGRFQDFDAYLVSEIEAYEAYKKDYASRLPDPSFRIVLGALILGALLLVGLFFLLGSLGIVPLLVGLGLIVAAGAGWVAVSELRCPSCRRHFARTGKTFVATDNRRPFFRVHCRHCGHRWWTWRDT